MQTCSFAAPRVGSGVEPWKASMEIVIASVHYWINMLGIEIFWLVSPDHVYVQDISRMI